jgi:DNA mismatch repair protein MutL
MARIALLSPELASQIAAGEVVERPASVVKELVENALDAEATRCDLEIEGGGVARIVVTDDGVGMDAEDASRALERHATSKLARLADLERIVSYGFRGEALPSIASVSRLKLETREHDVEAGTEIRVEPGAAPTVRPSGLRPGTRIEVADLFFNVPARRKFLRSTGTEAGHVTEVLESRRAVRDVRAPHAEAESQHRARGYRGAGAAAPEVVLDGRRRERIPRRGRSLVPRQPP